jgi:retron-type reverse transcriptase
MRPWPAQTRTTSEHPGTRLQEGQYESSVAALEDKVLQRAVVGVLNAIYEEDFRGFSYGFRPGRGPHDALDALAAGVERRKVNWVLDADIRDFLDPWSYCSFADCAA